MSLKCISKSECFIIYEQWNAVSPQPNMGVKLLQVFWVSWEMC